MPFEEFQKGSAPVSTVPAITIQKRGLFSVNDAAYKMLGEPMMVTFLWDAEARRIAISPSDESNLNAYPARRQNQSKGTGPVLIAGTMFAKFIGIDTTNAKRWTPSLEDGMLILDLNVEGSLVIANRNRPKQDESGDAD
ncbi:hypothetical protein [Allobranchiibius huperziae]|uniref:Uncharacterized protein n=1 Tax=Allobranchiibius huperziae TaxID=1874116 RepID=A0A853DQV5_9MICO|nr:hypothetical protein [Allobranchiibius huperziae]NYJ76505.1 hypothetical protein [Allobranchiibius huperziae]